jgi:hypothetical protein
MDELELRLECVRIASENVKTLHGAAFDEQVLEYAERLFRFIRDGELKKAA